MKSVLSVNKPLGMTPLACIERVKKRFPELSDQKIAYAGRLDPMASGVLLLLIGDECKKRDSYQMLPKRYTLTVLFGFETDTYDLLGLITKTARPDLLSIQEALKSTLSTLKGKHLQSYPPYSSARVQGKPLFYYARHNLLADITIPQKTISITEVTLDAIDTIASRKLYEEIQARLLTITGDFRQDDIKKGWKNKLEGGKEQYVTARLSIATSHGAYMRAIAQQLGESLGVPACAYSIVRTHVGEYSIEKALTLSSEAVE
jgi:tRNA pseudouridine55 synthase